MSSDESIDAALRQVAERPRAEEAVDDGLLLAYRQGRLSEEKSAELEALLARDPEARALLAELSKPIDRGLVDQLQHARSSRRRWPMIAGALAAAAAAALVAIVPARQPAWPAY